MKTKFKMYRDDVRTMCIKNEMCTKCNCKQYDELLNQCNFEFKNFEIVKIKLYEIAKLIYNYSNEQTIENIMFCLMRDCVLTFFEFDE